MSDWDGREKRGKERQKTLSEEREHAKKERARDDKARQGEREPQKQKTNQSLQGREKIKDNSTREAHKATGSDDMRSRRENKERGEGRAVRAQEVQGACITTTATSSSARVPKELPKIPRKEAGDLQARAVRRDGEDRRAAGDGTGVGRDSSKNKDAATGRAAVESRWFCTFWSHDDKPIATHWYHARATGRLGQTQTQTQIQTERELRRTGTLLLLLFRGHFRVSLSPSAFAVGASALALGPLRCVSALRWACPVRLREPSH